MSRFDASPGPIRAGERRPGLPVPEGLDKTPPPSSRLFHQTPIPQEAPLGTGSRLLLVAVGVCLLAGFGLSAWLAPDSRGHGTHQQLGLAPCSFRLLLGIPCPSCGSTTSFAHFVRGEWASAVRANAAAFVLAVICAVIIPWSWMSAVRGRLLGNLDLERTILTVVIVMTCLFAMQWIVWVALG
jgi:Protein of unknown function (DUF2752)